MSCSNCWPHTCINIVSATATLTLGVLLAAIERVPTIASVLVFWHCIVKATLNQLLSNFSISDLKTFEAAPAEPLLAFVILKS